MPSTTPKATPKSATSTTPARNNYAAPHTPIASAKRPRSSMDKSMLSPGGGRLPSAPLDEENEVLDYGDVPETPKDNGKNAMEANLSPMHPARPLVAHTEESAEELQEEGDHDHESSWVGRKVDQLFSPMLNLLSGDDDDQDGEAKQLPDDEEEDAMKPAGTDSTSHTTVQETEEEEEEEVEQQPDEEEQMASAAAQEDEVLVEDDHSSQASEEEEEDEFNPYAFIKSLPKYELVEPLRPPISLPPKDGAAPPVSLVLDLDETLVHCTVEAVDDADLVFPVVFHGITYQVHVRLRPYLHEFLEKIAGKFEVIVFTASQKVYANELLNLIDPGKHNECGVSFANRKATLVF
ncbi:MAG: hypothetical protein SGILL_000064 [Bacillariaceae sp.]